jgi:hypothetical protein
MSFIDWHWRSTLFELSHFDDSYHFD